MFLVDVVPPLCRYEFLTMPAIIICIYSHPRKCHLNAARMSPHPHRTEAGAAAQPDGDGVPERVPDHVAVATGAGASDPILHDQVSDRCGLEDAEPGPDSARGLVVSCKESGRRTDVLLPCAGQFAEELRVE